MSDVSTFSVKLLYGGWGVSKDFKRFDNWYDVTNLDFLSLDFSLDGLTPLVFGGRKPLTISPLFGGCYEFKASRNDNGSLLVTLGGIPLGQIKNKEILRSIMNSDLSSRALIDAERVKRRVLEDLKLSKDLARLQKFYKSLSLSHRRGFLAFILSEFC